MIPKIIHYCWLSDDPIPQQLQNYMDTWKQVLPDYEWVKWDFIRFDINSSIWVKEAFENKKYAFAADYIRLFAIYTMGGIYLDMDIEVLKSFDEFLDNGFFTINEYYPESFRKMKCGNLLDKEGHRVKEGKIAFGLQAAVLGGEKGSQYVKELMSYYENRHFVLPDGSLDTKVIAPTIYARQAEQWGFVYRDVEQHLDNRVSIYPSNYVAATADMLHPDNYAVHHCAHSWADPLQLTLFDRIVIRIKRIFK